MLARRLLRGNPSSILLFAASFFAGNLFLISTAFAANITVTVLNDELNDDEDCSLREAVVAANTNTAIGGCAAGDPSEVATDVITLGAGNHTLDIFCDVIEAVQPANADVGANNAVDFGTECGDLDISEDVVINGAGIDDTTVTVETVDFIGDLIVGSSAYSRAFDIQAVRDDVEGEAEDECLEGCTAGLSVTLSNFTVQGGEEYYGGAIHFGGGIRGTCQFTSLTLTNIRAQNNSAHYGGGAVAGYGQLIINGGEYINNSVGFFTSYFRGGRGGAIYLAGPEHYCYQKFDSSITNASITGNNAFHGSGGGVYNSYFSNLSLTGCTVDNNGAYLSGGGVHNHHSNLTVTGGSISNNQGIDGLTTTEEEEDPRVYYGGGIFNSVVGGITDIAVGSLNLGEFTGHSTTVNGTNISNNKAAFGGGGIANVNDYFGCFRFRGELTSNLLFFCDADEEEFETDEFVSDSFSLSNATVMGNTLSGFFGGGGAGIMHSEYAGTFSIVDTTIKENIGGYIGGGIYNLWVMDIDRSTLNDNSTFNLPFFTVGDVGSEEVVTGSTGGGGGLANQGSAILTNTTVSGNSTYGLGAGVANNLSEFYHYAWLDSNGIVNNEDDHLLLPPLPEPGVDLRNTTITNNTVLELPEPSPEPSASPSALNDLEFVTANNGGGIATLQGPIRVRNSIVAGNNDLSTTQDGFILNEFDTVEDVPETAPDCWIQPRTLNKCQLGDDDTCQDLDPSIVSEGYNIIGDNTGCSAFAPATNDNFDQVGTTDSPIDPLLGPLEDNGGSTFSHLPLKGSPAIDMGNPNPTIIEPAGLSTRALVNAAALACEGLDQRGLTRAVDGSKDGVSRCDVGALEPRTDCAADPKGIQVLDACGVCGGDGSSCAPTPTPNPDVGITCDTENIESIQFNMDGTSIAQTNLARGRRSTTSTENWQKKSWAGSLATDHRKRELGMD